MKILENIARVVVFLFGLFSLVFFFIAAKNHGDWFVLVPGIIIGIISFIIAFMPGSDTETPNDKQKRD